MEETGRITEHIRYILNNLSGFPVERDGSTFLRCSINDFSVTGIIQCNCRNLDRLNIENRIIFQQHYPSLELAINLKCFHQEKALCLKRREINIF